MKNIGLRPEKALKEKNEYSWWRQPVWIQTLIMFLIVVGGFFYNMSTLDAEVTKWWLGITSMKLSTLFVTSFAFNLFLFAYMFMVSYFTGNITNKLLLCKLLKKRLLFYKGADRVFRFFIPKTNELTWEVEDVGEFTINDGSMGWLQNGTIMMPCTYGHAEGIDYEDIKHRQILKIDPSVFEERNQNVRLQAAEDEKKMLNSQFILQMATVLLIIGIVGYLLVGQLQTGECQGQLVNLAARCGETAAPIVEETVTATTLASKMPSNIPEGMNILP